MTRIVIAIKDSLCSQSKGGGLQNCNTVGDGCNTGISELLLGHREKGSELQDGSKSYVCLEGQMEMCQLKKGFPGGGNSMYKIHRDMKQRGYGRLYAEIKSLLEMRSNCNYCPWCAFT